MLSGIYYPDEGRDLSSTAKEVVIRSPKDALRLRHRHDPSAFQARGRAHGGGKYRSRSRPGQARSQSSLGKDPRDLRQIRLRAWTLRRRSTICPSPRSRPSRSVQGSLPRRGHPHSGRADRRSHAAGDATSSSPYLRNMRDDGKAIVIITHKMHEVEALSDRVAHPAATASSSAICSRQHTNAQEMTNMMVGHAGSR